MLTQTRLHYLAICAIFRDETPYLDEWLQFHRAAGVEHFYLYDNQSADNPETVLAPFIDAGLVTLIQWDVPFHHAAQSKAYQDCLERTRGQVRWLAFIDIDEFLFAPRDVSFASALNDFENFPGIVVHWQVYGSSGQAAAGTDPVIARFLWRAPSQWARNRKIKSIVDPERTLGPISVHHFAYRDDALAVDENGAPATFRPKSRFKKQRKRLYSLLGPLLRYWNVDPYKGADIEKGEISVERLRINHYPVKSREEFQVKARLKGEKRRYDDLDYFAYHDRNEVYDPVLLSYADILRQ